MAIRDSACAAPFLAPLTFFLASMSVALEMCPDRLHGDRRDLGPILRGDGLAGGHLHVLHDPRIALFLLRCLRGFLGLGSLVIAADDEGPACLPGPGPFQRYTFAFSCCDIL